MLPLCSPDFLLPVHLITQLVRIGTDKPVRAVHTLFGDEALEASKGEQLCCDNYKGAESRTAFICTGSNVAAQGRVANLETWRITMFFECCPGAQQGASLAPQPGGRLPLRALQAWMQKDKYMYMI